MKQTDWSKINQLYYEALERSPEERSGFLLQACPDADLRHEVESLLGYDKREFELLDNPVASMSAADSLVSESAPALHPNDILGSYRVLGRIGAGGMGEVYSATDLKLGREVALKVLPGNFAGVAGRSERFTAEAQLLASMNHPNIGAIYGLEESGGVRAVILELVEGPTLADRLRQGKLTSHQAFLLQGRS